MSHLPLLIQDLCLILITAAVISLLFKKLKQPVVLGYLIAGFLVGSHFKYLPAIQDTANIKIWAEIGVIFLLFGLGLEFSFKKLAKVGKSATITAVFEISFMLGVGYLLGQALGWSRMDSLFLGGILSISSTTIIVRAFEELGLKGKSFVSLVFGVLIVEDLIAILLMVLLTSVAVTQTLSGAELFNSSMRLGFFMVLWFLLGIYILPIVLRKLKNYLSDETTLIVSIGLCLFMVIVASKVGFSPALGAFVMGSIFSETRESHRIERLILPVKDLFSAVFFVSVGMLIDPSVLKDYMFEITLITFVTMIGKLVSSSLGAIISGSPLKTSIQAGMSLAQIGEFSFIIATLGLTLKVTSSHLYPIAVAVSAITTFATPYLIKNAIFVFGWIDQKLPETVKSSMTRYELAMSTNSEKNVLSLIWHEYGIKIVFNSVLIVALTLAMSRLVMPWFSSLGFFESSYAVQIFMSLLTLVFASPFLWAIFVSAPAHSENYRLETINQLRRLQLGVTYTKFLIGCLLAGFLVSNFTSIFAFTGVFLIAVAAVAAFFFSKYSEPIYKSIEKKFLENLNENEKAELEKRAKVPELAPWNATMADFVLSPDSMLVAKSLQDSKLKELFGVTVAMIERGHRRILAPVRGDMLLPFDRVFLIGTEEQLQAARGVIEVQPTMNAESGSDHFGLTSLIVLSTDSFANKSIRDCGLREAVSGLIVGIERNGNRYLSPDSSMKLLENDLLWIVCDRTMISSLRS